MEIKTIKFSKQDIAFAPTRKHPTDAGIDLYALDSIIIPDGKMRTVRTGIYLEIPKYCVGFLWPKGRSDFLIGAGVVDEGYQGEYIIKVFNCVGYDLVIKRAEPVAQLVIVPIVGGDFEEKTLEELFPEKSERGDTGGIKSTMFPESI
jgi:dUTP pyrophosphatase